jgi:D-hydroxyproline dehydrogenase subunit beta
MDVLIIGAGIVGAACAQELTAVGLSVGIVERDEPGSGATAIGMGHVLALDNSEAQIRLTAYSRSLWHRLSLSDGAGFRTTGTMWIASNREEMSAIERRHDFYRQYGVGSEVVGRDKLFELEPALAPFVMGGLRIPGDAVVSAQIVTNELLDQASRAGARYFRSEVKSIGPHSVQLTSGETIAAPHIVLATGVDATALLPGLPLRKRKGHLAITDSLPQPLIRHQVIETGYLQSAHGSEQASVAFNLQPRSTGQLLIGSSREFASNPEVDPTIVDRMIKRAVSFVPALAGCVIARIWTGFRGATSDGLPLIGPYANVPGLILATGHEGLGITTSLGTAKLVRQHVTGAKAEIDPTPYLPDRQFSAT